PQLIFAFPYHLPAREFLRVSKVVGETETILTEGIDYSVQLSILGVGGATVTLASEAAAGETIRLERIVPLTQPFDFRDQGEFSPDAYEVALDRLEMQIQQLAAGGSGGGGGGGGGGITGAENTSTGAQIYAGVSGSTLRFRPIRNTAKISVIQEENWIRLDL